jgi:uncharacterized protein (UPF0332 family)
LLHDGVEMSRHSGVIAAIHQRYIKTGKLDRTQGKSLNWLFELRSVGDYGGLAHVSRTEVEQAIAVAERFLQAVFALMNSSADALQNNDTAAFGQGQAYPTR